MPCDTPRRNVNPIVRKKQIDEALDRLRKALTLGQVKLKIGPTGSVTFVGNWERNDVTDLCAYRRLLAASSPELRLAIIKAEAEAGRKVNPQAIAAGVHSHDGGKTWGSH